MGPHDILPLVVYLVALIALAIPLGAWIAKVAFADPAMPGGWLGNVERVVYRSCGIDPARSMNAWTYGASVLGFSLVSLIVLCTLLRVQHLLPFAQDGVGPMDFDLALNTAVSFVTNTNWQSYSGEVGVTQFSQAMGLTVQNFLSAAVGIAILVAICRGIRARGVENLGNFWVDVTRVVLFVLLPLSVILALALLCCGVPQGFGDAAVATTLEGSSQPIPVGPVASQVAIKQLGTNGGGYFGVNSAHPLENPGPVSNFLQTLSILLIPAALCFSFGRAIGDRRQGLALFLTMLAVLVPCFLVTATAESSANPRIAEILGPSGSADAPTGNLEGKELRFGIAGSALWAVATTAASNGSVNSMHDAYTPLGSIPPFFLMQLGEVIFGGVGSGLYGMLAFVILAVFVAGLLVGRTPEVYGKKIEAFEVKMAVIAVLAPTAAILLSTAAAVSWPSVRAAVDDAGPHAFSEILYCFTSQGANNGSAFGGFGCDRPFVNLVGALAMAIGRFVPAIAMLAVAGSLARKKLVPPGAGTLPTHSPQFAVWLLAVVVIVGALSFLPALVLGPVAEHFLSIGS